MLVTLQSTFPSPQTWRSQATNVFTLTKKHHMIREVSCYNLRSRGTCRWSDASGRFLKAKELLSVHTEPHKWPHFKLTLKKHSLLVSMMGDTTAFIWRVMLQHPLSCPSWLPQSEPGVIPPCQSLSTPQPSTNTTVFPTTHPAAHSFQTQPTTTACLGPSWHQVSADEQTCPGSKIDRHEQKGFKEAFGNTSHVLMSSAV